MNFNKMTLHKSQFLEACLDAHYDPPPSKFISLDQLQQMMESSNCYVFTQTLKPSKTTNVSFLDQELDSAKILQNYFYKKGYYFYMKPERTAANNIHWHGWIWKIESTDDCQLKQLKKYMGQRLGCIKIYRVYDIYNEYIDYDYPAHPLHGLRTTSLKSQVKYICKDMYNAYWWWTREF